MGWLGVVRGPGGSEAKVLCSATFDTRDPPVDAAAAAAWLCWTEGDERTVLTEAWHLFINTLLSQALPASLALWPSWFLKRFMPHFTCPAHNEKLLASLIAHVKYGTCWLFIALHSAGWFITRVACSQMICMWSTVYRVSHLNAMQPQQYMHSSFACVKQCNSCDDSSDNF